MVDPNEYRTKDGLFSTVNLRWHAECLYLSPLNREVYVEPRVQGVTEYLRPRPHLWDIAQIELHLQSVSLRGAPIFGVPFDIALDLLSRDHPAQFIVKSMYQRLDSEHLSAINAGVIGTLVVHLSRPRQNDDLITLEAWEVMNIDGAETFYIHGQFSANDHCWKHLDGATIYHDEIEKATLLQHGRKVKGSGYKKRFRLDGEFDTEDVRNIVRAFVPLDDLPEEYLQAIPGIVDAR